jgi:hypothetical protein
VTQGMQDPLTEAYRTAHERSDTDADRSAIHHTLGLSPNQAAPGNHEHDEAPPHTHLEYSTTDHEHPEYEWAENYEVPAGEVLKLKKAVTGPSGLVVTQDIPYTIPQINHNGLEEVIVSRGKIFGTKSYTLDGHETGTGDSAKVYVTDTLTGVKTVAADNISHYAYARGIEFVDGYFYIYAVDFSPVPKVFKFDTDWTLISSVTMFGSTGYEAFCYNNDDDCWVLSWRNGSNEVNFRKLNRTTGALIANVNSGWVITTPLTILNYGTFDFGGSRYVVGIENVGNNAKLWVLNTAFALQANEHWERNTAYTCKAIGWDGTNFWQQSESVIWKYTTDWSTVAANMLRHFAATSKAPPADGYVSTIGEVVAHSSKKRWRTKVTLPAPITGVEDYDVYAKRQADATYKLQIPIGGATPTVKYFNDITETAGAAPPGASTFPAALPAAVLDETETYGFDADGHAVFNTLSVGGVAVGAGKVEGGFYNGAFGTSAGWAAGEVRVANPRPGTVPTACVPVSANGNRVATWSQTLTDGTTLVFLLRADVAGALSSGAANAAVAWIAYYP